MPSKTLAFHYRTSNTQNLPSALTAYKRATNLSDSLILVNFVPETDINYDFDNFNFSLVDIYLIYYPNNPTYFVTFRKILPISFIATDETPKLSFALEKRLAIAHNAIIYYYTRSQFLLNPLIGLLGYLDICYINCPSQNNLGDLVIPPFTSHPKQRIKGYISHPFYISPRISVTRTRH